jgi:hypothetical protein
MPTAAEKVDHGRFQIVFKHLEELADQEASDSDGLEETRRASESIDELRRLSAEFAEPPTISYTST